MKPFVVTLGVVFSLIGLLLLVSPVPGATAMLALGIALLICSSTTAARLLQRLRGNVAWLNRAFRWLENHAGEKIGDALKRTRPLDQT